MNNHHPERAISSFETLTGLRVCVHDLKNSLGKFLKPERTWHGGPFCKSIKNSPLGNLCYQSEVSDLYPRLLDIEQQGGLIRKCHAGMIEWIVPVLKQKVPQFVLFAGQRIAKNWNPHEQDTQSSIKLHTRPPSVDQDLAEHYLEALNQLAERLKQFSIQHNQSLSKTREQKIYHFIETRHTEPIKIEDLALSLGLSESRTAHSIKEATGSSWSELLNRCRLKHACELLHHTEMSIIDVAHYSGFGDQSHFQKIFKREMGLTPGQFRRDQEGASSIKQTQ